MAEKTKEELIKDYQKEGIKTLAGLAAVRKRPGMYVGSTQSIDGHNSHALIQIAQEILSNAVDEAYAGFGNHITMTVNLDGSMTVTDQGRGMPRGKNYDDVIRAMTVLHSSGKFDSSSYASSIGINGVGQKACTALSKWVQVDAVTTSKEHYMIKFQQEKVVEKKMLPYDKSMHTGTSVTFLPDDTIFDMVDWEDEPLVNKLEQTAYLTPGVKFEFDDLRKPAIDDDDKHDHYHREWLSEHGLTDYVADIAKDSSLVPGVKKPIDFKGEYQYDQQLKSTNGQISHNKGTIQVSGALIYVEDSGTDIYSFANGAPTVDGGYHVDGAKMAISRAFRDYANDKKILKGKQSFDAQDTRDGLILTLLVKIPENILQFESQSKTKLSTAAAKSATQRIIYDNLTTWLYDHPKAAKSIILNMADSKKYRESAVASKKAAQKARKTKSLGNGKLLISSKLKPASSNDPKKKSLMVTEGDSASALFTLVRDKKYQAVFPLRGKILNTEHEKLGRVLKNEEITTIAGVLGAGIGSAFNVNDLEYDKVIILTDSDDDGMHISSLLITLFYNFFPGLIENGHLYKVTAPLYKTELKNNKSGRTKTVLAYSEAEKPDFDNQVSAWVKKGYSVVSAARYKGLGSLSKADTKKYIADPQYRKITKIVIDDDSILSKRMLNIWMGKDADLRKHQIESSVDFDRIVID